jgi:hypothetical protein
LTAHMQRPQGGFGSEGRHMKALVSSSCQLAYCLQLTGCCSATSRASSGLQASTTPSCPSHAAMLAGVMSYSKGQERVCETTR